LPDGFDSVSYLAAQGVQRVGVIDAESVRVIAPRPWYRIDQALCHFSTVRSERAHVLLSPETAPVCNALLFGRRENLESGDREAFARAGTAHLLAISGLHLNLLAWVLGLALGKLGVSRRGIAVSVVLLSVAYIFASGAPDSILRAAWMNAVYAGALWFRREADPLSAWSASGLSILFFRPADLFQPGFQLSFISVFALLTVYPAFEAAWSAWRESRNPIPKEFRPAPTSQDRALHWVRQSAFVSLAAWLGTAPIVAWHMGFFSPVTIFSNLIAVPLSFVAMLAGILLQMLDTVGLPALPDLLGAPTFLLLGFNRWAATAPGASFAAAAPTPLLLAVFGALLLVLWADSGRPRAGLRAIFLTPAALGVLWLSTAFFPGRWEEQSGLPRVTLLDLSRGHCAWVALPGNTHTVIDAGATGQGRRIAEVLRREGVQELSLLAITEDDPEAIGGALELAERIEIRKILLPETNTPSDALRYRPDRPAGFCHCGCE
jgi:competence protein ComEC